MAKAHREGDRESGRWRRLGRRSMIVVAALLLGSTAAAAFLSIALVNALSA